MKPFALVRLLFVALALSSAVMPGVNSAFARHGADDATENELNDVNDDNGVDAGDKD